MHIVYDTVTTTDAPYLVESIRATQALANAHAATRAALTAHQGAVTVPRHIQPGRGYFDPSDATFAADRIPVLTGAAMTRVMAARTIAAFADVVYPRIERIGWRFEYSLKADVEDLLLGVTRLAYMRVRDASIPHLRRQDYIGGLLLGPSEVLHPGAEDGTGTRELYRAAAATRYPSGWRRGRPVEFMEWNTAAGRYDQRTVQASVNAAATDAPAANWPDFGAVDILDPAWTASIT